MYKLSFKKQNKSSILFALFLIICIFATKENNIMKKRVLTLYTLLLVAVLSTSAQQRTFTPELNGLQVMANNDWLTPPVINLGTSDVINIGFDRMSHEYRTLTYHVEHCEADWTTSQELFDIDWLSGFNDQPIEDYAASINTTQSYTHYWLQIPNERTQLKMSGNYRLNIIDDDSGETVAEIRFMVVEPAANLGLAATTNTDIDTNREHQQVSMTLNYGQLNLTAPDEQLYTVVMQNQQWDEAVINAKPDRQNYNGRELEWQHCRALIFSAGNEWRKFETLDVSHTTMGLASMRWDGVAFNAYPFADEARRNYLTDADADGAFIIRNSDNTEIETTCDYVRVNYELHTPPFPADYDVIVSGPWATSQDPQAYTMFYDEADRCYRAAIWQKQGYYNYQYRLRKADGTTKAAPTEGNFYQTGNSYQAYVYYKGTGERTWRLVAFRQLIFK